MLLFWVINLEIYIKRLSEQPDISCQAHDISELSTITIVANPDGSETHTYSLFPLGMRRYMRGIINHGDDRNCMVAQRADVSIVIEIDIRADFRKMVYDMACSYK